MKGKLLNSRPKMSSALLNILFQQEIHPKMKARFSLNATQSTFKRVCRVLNVCFFFIFMHQVVSSAEVWDVCVVFENNTVNIY